MSNKHILCLMLTERCRKHTAGYLTTKKDLKKPLTKGRISVNIDKSQARAGDRKAKDLEN